MQTPLSSSIITLQVQSYKSKASCYIILSLIANNPTTTSLVTSPITLMAGWPRHYHHAPSFTTSPDDGRRVDIYCDDYFGQNAASLINTVWHSFLCIMKTTEENNPTFLIHTHVDAII